MSYIDRLKIYIKKNRGRIFKTSCFICMKYRQVMWRLVIPSKDKPELGVYGDSISFCNSCKKEIFPTGFQIGVQVPNYKLEFT